MSWDIVIEHLPNLVSITVGVGAWVRSRARKDAASAEAIEQLTRAHQACEVQVVSLTGDIAVLSDRTAQLAQQATTAESHARALDTELRRLMQEIQR